VLDPSLPFACMSPNDRSMREWESTYGGRILTISVRRAVSGKAMDRNPESKPTTADANELARDIESLALDCERVVQAALDKRDAALPPTTRHPEQISKNTRNPAPSS